MADVDNAIRVSVVPAQSAFFAGETFSMTITFTNTRNPNTPLKRSSHKRAAHSISSAPLARPPTSPITPRTAVPVPVSRQEEREKNRHERKGLIGSRGVGSALNRISSLDKGKKKALSVSLSPNDIDDVLSASNSPGPGPSPLRASTVAAFPPHHPHARKQSVLIDAQSQTQLQLKDMTPSQSPVHMPQSAAASTSAFSLSLDTISEHAPSASSHSHAYPPSPAPLTNSDSHSYPPRRPSFPQSGVGLGIGLGPPPNLNAPPRTAPASATTFAAAAAPNAALILYAYAQLAGSLVLADSGNALGRVEGASLASLRGALARRARGAVGGGRLDIGASRDSQARLSGLAAGPVGARPRATRTHSRAASLGSSLLSFLSPSTSSTSSGAPNASQPFTPGHRARTPSSSLFSSLISTSVSSPADIGRRPGPGADVPRDPADEDPGPDAALPTFDLQPAMLAVDLVLGPGESRSCEYRVD